MKMNDKAMATGAAFCCATKGLLLAASLSCVMLAAPGIASAQEVLPFPPKPSGSAANLTMQDSATAHSRQHGGWRPTCRTSSSYSLMM